MGVDKFVGFYSSMVELDTVNIMIDVRFILGANTLFFFYIYIK